MGFNYPVQIHLIKIRNSPDHYSVHNKEVKFIWIYSLGRRFRVRIRESSYYRGSFLKKIYENFVETLKTVCNICRGVCIKEVSVPRGSTLVSRRKRNPFVVCLRPPWNVRWHLKTEANIIIFSLNHYCILNILLKIFCYFLFLPFKGSKEFAFRTGYSNTAAKRKTYEHKI